MVAQIQKIWNQIAYYGSFSVSGKAISAFARWVRRLLDHSFIASTLADEKIFYAADKSLFGRLLQKIWSIFPWFGKKFGGLAANSSFVASIGHWCRHWEEIPLAAIGSFLAAFSLGLFFRLNTVIGGAVLIFGLILMLIPATLGNALSNSGILRFLTGHTFETKAEGRIGIYLWPCIFGLLLAAATYLWGWLPAAAILALAVGGAVLMTEPAVGLCLCVFLTPFLPTMAMAGLIGVIILCYGLRLMGGVEYRFRIDTAALLFIAFGVILIFFAVTGFAPSSSIRIAMLECLFIAAYPLMILLMDSKEKIHAMVFLFCLGAFFAGLVGLYQYLSGAVDTTWTDTTLFEDLQLRVYSTFDNPNVYGEYLLMAIPMAGVMCYIAKRPLMKIFYGGTTLLLLLNLGLTYSRGCYLAIMVAVFIFVWFGARQLMILCIPALLALPFVMPASIVSRFASIINFADNSTSYRLSIWQGTVSMLEHYWMLGIGLGESAFNTVYPLYAHDSTFAQHAHSLYLQTLSETGIGGFVLLICALFAFLSIAYVAQRKVRGTKTMWFIIAMMAGITAFLFQGIFDYVWYNYRVFLLFFITMGITGAVSYLVMKEGKAVFD